MFLYLREGARHRSSVRVVVPWFHRLFCLILSTVLPISCR